MDSLRSRLLIYARKDPFVYNAFGPGLALIFPNNNNMFLVQEPGDLEAAPNIPDILSILLCPLFVFQKLLIKLILNRIFNSCESGVTTVFMMLAHPVSIPRQESRELKLQFNSSHNLKTVLSISVCSKGKDSW